MECSGRAWLAEFRLTQNGPTVSGPWWVPTAEWRGTITGTIDAERNFRGRMGIDSPCVASGDLRWGLLDYSEQSLTVTAAFAGTCGFLDEYTFILDRHCRVTSVPSLACD